MENNDIFQFVIGGLQAIVGAIVTWIVMQISTLHRRVNDTRDNLSAHKLESAQSYVHKNDWSDFKGEIRAQFGQIHSLLTNISNKLDTKQDKS